VNVSCLSSPLRLHSPLFSAYTICSALADDRECGNTPVALRRTIGVINGATLFTA
jgi:hypothetical protein